MMNNIGKLYLLLINLYGVSALAGIGANITYDFGRVTLGQSKTQTWNVCETDPDTKNYVQQLQVTGSAEFSVVSDTCTSRVISTGQCCSLSVRYAPTTQTILKSQAQQAGFSAHNTEVWDPPDGDPVSWQDDVLIEVSGEGIIPQLPPIEICPGNSAGSAITTVGSSVPANSSINIHTLALEEQIPLVGVPFLLSYSSDLKRLRLEPKLFGLGGWVPSVMHYYDPVDQILYYGSGEAVAVQAKIYSGGYYVTSPSGKEVYFFNADGFHQETKESLQSLVVYSFSYSTQGKLLAISDRFSNTTTFAYSTGFVTMTAPYGQQTRLNLASSGFLSSVVNPKNETWYFQHDTNGFLLQKKKPEGQISTVTYDAYGFVKKDLGYSGDFLSVLRQYNLSSGKQTVTLTTAEGRNTLYESTANTSLSSTNKVTYSSGYVLNDSRQRQGAQTATESTGTVSSSTVAAHPRFGTMSSYTSASSVQVPNTGININSTVSISTTLSSPSNPLSSLLSQTITTVLQNNSARTYMEVSSQQSAGKLKIEYTTPLNTKRTEYYNALGLLESTQLGGLTPTSFVYDSRGKLKETNSGGRKTQIFYNTAGNVEQINNALNQPLRFTYDNANRVLQQTFPDLRAVQYGYDKNGNLISLTTPKNIVHSFTFNPSDLASTYSPPGGSAYVTSYEYNNDNQVKKITRPGNDQLIFEYSPTSGVLSRIVSGAGNYDITTNPVTGLPTLLSNPASLKVRLTYAGPYIAKEESVSASGTVLSSYEKTFSGDFISADTVKGGDGVASAITYEFNNDGKLSRAGGLNISYDANGLLSGTTIGSGAEQIVEVYTRNSFGEITGYSASRGGSVIYTYATPRDNLGRVSSKTETLREKTTSYEIGYDESGRVSQVKKSGTAISNINYDLNSNRISGNFGPQPISATYDDQDRVLSYNTYNFTYNAKGETLSKVNAVTSVGKTFSYDPFGHLIQVTTPTKTITYEVDSRGRRVSRSVNGTLIERYVYMDDLRIAAVVNASGAVAKRFVYGSKANVPDYMIIGSEKYRLITDHLGSIRLVVKMSDGSIAERIDYDIFGNVTLDSNTCFQPFGFAGGLRDQDSGLVHFGARDYDPEIGRWTSKDPILFNGRDTNLYGYVQNDPVNFIDPSGKVLEKVFAKWISPDAQKRVGEVAAGAGACLIVAGVISQNPALALSGAALGYEGGKQLQEAAARGAATEFTPLKNFKDALDSF